MFNANRLIRSTIFCITASALFSATSFAGRTTTHPVTIDFSAANPVVTGSFVSAKNSQDNIQLLRIVDRGSNMRLVARDASANQVVCVTDNEEDIAALRNLNDSSFVRYAVSDSVCINAIVRNGSQY